MPAKGFVTITVSEKTHTELKHLAKKTRRSIPKTVEYLMDLAKQNPSKKEA